MVSCQVVVRGVLGRGGHVEGQHGGEGHIVGVVQVEGDGGGGGSGALQVLLQSTAVAVGLLLVMGLLLGCL